MWIGKHKISDTLVTMGAKLASHTKNDNLQNMGKLEKREIEYEIVWKIEERGGKEKEIWKRINNI